MRFIIAIVLIAAAPAAAQLPAEVMGCVTIPRDADRLACFDASVAKTSPQARAAAETRAVESARINAAEARAAAATAKASAEADTAKKAEAFGGEAVAARGKDRIAPLNGE